MAIMAVWTSLKVKKVHALLFLLSSITAMCVFSPWLSNYGYSRGVFGWVGGVWVTEQPILYSAHISHFQFFFAPRVLFVYATEISFHFLRSLYFLELVAAGYRSVCYVVCGGVLSGESAG